MKMWVQVPPAAPPAHLTHVRNMKILLVDLETSPNLGYVWGKYEQNVLSYTQESYLISFAYKWLDENKVHSFSLPDFKTYKKDKNNDKALCIKLWELFNQADVIVAHNGDEFDIKKANAYFIRNGLTPPSGYKTVDTKKVAKRYFMFNSNKLDDLGNYLGLGRKIETGGFELWLKCLAGDMKAWKKMVDYNKQDVALLENVYLKLRPWMLNHPNVCVEEMIDGCPNCGSKKLQKRGYNLSRTGRRQRYQCQSCSAWSQGKHEKLLTIS